MKTWKQLTGLGLLVAINLAGLGAGSAAPRLPSVIADHATFERGVPMPIWGWADPGEAVTVSIAGADSPELTC